MHMISKKDLNSAEMDTLTKSCSPTIVITANGEVQTHEEATVYVKELDIFLAMKVLEDTPAVLSLGKLCDEHGYSYEWINGQKPHLIKNGIRIQCNTENFVPIVVPGLSTSSSSSFSFSTSMTSSRQEIDHPTSCSNSSTSPTTTVSSDSETSAREDLCGIDSHPAPVPSSHVERTERCDPLTKPTKIPKPNKNEDHETERSDPLYSDIPEWLQEFRENLVDERVPECRDSHASSSHEPSLQPTPTRSVDLGKHSVYTHFLKTDIARFARGTKLQGPRAEDALITADHKVLSEGCESRNTHSSICNRGAGLGHPRDPVISVKNKSFSGNTKEFAKVLGSLKSLTLTIPWNLARPVKIFPGIIARRHHTDRKQMGLLKRAVRRVKEGTSAVLLQSGLDENWWADSMECYTYLRNVTDLLSDGKTTYERRFGKPFKGPVIPFGSLVEYYHISAKDQSRIHQFGKNVLPRLFLGYALYAGGNLEG